MPSEVTAASLEEARAVLAPVIRATTATYSHSLSSRFDRAVWLKPEYRQRTGSFKIRGAYLMQSRLPEGSAVVAASAGNHAQGVALAARSLGQDAVVFMPIGASLPKVQATIGYGARVEIVGDTVDDCLAIAREYASATGAVFVPPFDHPDIVLGQATLAPEMLDEVPGLANVVVAIGGGGLCGGIGAGIKALAPEVRVVGVAAEGAASIRQSLDAGRPVDVEPRTLADGIALRAPSALTLDLIARYVDEVVTVADEQISQAMLLLAERAKAVVEPAGAVPLAAMLADVPLADGPTALVLGGGNVDPLLFAKLIEHGLGAAGRYLSLQIVMDDRPGSLASLTQQIATLRLNVLDVEHHRSGRRLPLGSVEVQLTVETRDHDHQAEVMTSLRTAGFEVEPIS